MVTTSFSIEIKAPRAQVFEYATDPSKVAEWQTNVLNSEGEAGLPVGSILTMDTHVLGRRSNFTIEVVENDGQSRTRARSIRGPVKFETVYEYVALTPETCRLNATVKIEAGAIYRLAEPALQSITHNVIEADLKMLKAILEHEIT